MRALVCERAGHVALKEVPEPEPGPGEVVVRVEATLTCGTDLKLIRRGHPKVAFPTVLGHEACGLVARVGDGAPFAVGERVASGVTGPCGRCDECRSGRPNLCATAFEDILDLDPDTLDPACAGVDHVFAARRDVPLRAALSNSFAFGGSNAVLAFRAVPQ